MAKSLDEAESLGAASVSPTHNHPEGIKGAKVIAGAIWLARNGRDKNVIRAYVEKLYYPLTQSIDEIRPYYTFNETCQETVPQAVQAFLESTDFEDAIRNAISLGGDSDTLAAIAGSVAEAYYGLTDEVRDWMDRFALKTLAPKEMQIVAAFRKNVLERKREEPAAPFEKDSAVDSRTSIEETTVTPSFRKFRLLGKHENGRNREVQATAQKSKVESE